MYLCFCITRSISLAKRDAGSTIHSFFLRDSLLYIVAKRFDITFNAGIFHAHLFIFYKAKTKCNFSKALSAEHQIVFLDHTIECSTSSAPPCAFSVRKLLSASLFVISWFRHNYSICAPKCCLKKPIDSSLFILWLFPIFERFLLLRAIRYPGLTRTALT